jgi:iron complex outermembrane recepter protein
VTASVVLVAALLAPISVQASAQQHDFNVRPGRLLHGAQAIAAQAGVDVVVQAPLRGRAAAGVNGRLTVDQAFERLLRPTGARAVRLADGVYRIEATPPARPTPPPPRPAAPTVLDEVIVTASVRRGGLSEATGRTLVSPAGLDRAEGVASSEAVADLSATVDSTRQGSGRNKLFVRGLADSAFNGPLQSTIGQYLGDLRLTYGSPDPDLALIDIARVEVFEGPQGARFGAGSIGGVVRVEPAPPSFADAGARFAAGLSATSGGAPGADAAAVFNQPLGDDAAARFVIYGRRDGGFLDNPARGVDAADGVETFGARGAIRLVRNGWTFDLMAVGQDIMADDAQAIPATDQRLSRDRPVAEPYRSTLALAGVTASRDIGTVRLTSATSLSRQTLKERFDATEPGGEASAAVDRHQSIWALSSEFRAESDPDARWSWTGGAALALGETRAERRRVELSQAPNPTYGSDLDRTFAEAAVFGEAVARPAPGLRLAFGGRLAAVRLVYDIRTVGQDAVKVVAPRDDGVSITASPTVSARWTGPFGWSAFIRFDQAVRPGGVSESDGGVQSFASDHVTLWETGVQTPQTSKIQTQVSIGWQDWRNIQADVATQGGDLATGNIGDGRIRFVSARAAWTPTPTVELSGGLFLNDSLVRIDQPTIIGVSRAPIPNVAPVGAQLAVDHGGLYLAGLPLALGASLRYVGKSRLGLGPGLDVPQGGYLRTELTARLGPPDRAFSLRISNPLDVQATRYGIGSPYRLFDPQAVPLRPLTVRLGFEAAF